MTVLSIHQPNYIPYLGYFYKIARSDIFVYLDNVQYPRGSSFSSRNRFKTPNGVTFLTIPITIPSGKRGKVTYNEVQFTNDAWKSKHLKSVTMSYSRAPFYDDIYEIYSTLLNNSISLVSLNIDLIEAFCEYLRINNTRVRLSENLPVIGKSTQLIVDICNYFKADTYYSGTGGSKSYLSNSLLLQNDIELVYSDFVHPTYPQLWGSFVENLSILDLLFNCGPGSIEIILGSSNVTV